MVRMSPCKSGTSMTVGEHTTSASKDDNLMFRNVRLGCSVISQIVDDGDDAAKVRRSISSGML